MRRKGTHDWWPSEQAELRYLAESLGYDPDVVHSMEEFRERYLNYTGGVRAIKPLDTGRINIAPLLKRNVQ